ncbi:MAG: nucleotide-diphospho-sugar transferase [Bacteroidetes bacterium]|nr:nucleotide-diphospho-sugar transferase [Bacteroidota bacterium]
MITSEFNTPILFMIFNRPDTTYEVFESIRKIKPKKLFVSADGPRPNKPGEDEKCRLTRDVVKKIDWDCELHTNFSDTNLGCKKGVTKGINWFFENVDEGIILEDDCLADASFFKLCSELLEKYRDNENIMHIGGVNFQDGIKRGNASYYFSRYCHVWGWATWKRAWSKYDVTVKNYDENKYDEAIRTIIPDKDVRDYYKRYFNLVKNNQLDTWDYQWVWTVWSNNGLSVIPNVNLVTNIGFGEEATHTTDTSNNLSNIQKGSVNEIIHPENIAPDLEADRYTYNTKMKKSKLSKLISLIKSKF